MLALRMIFTAFCILSFSITAQETITFPSKDALPITANVYISQDNTAPFIVLFHQAGWSRGEYLEIAPKLNEMGFNCMAIDQRSGKGVNEVENETVKAAIAKDLATDYPDALPDMIAAIGYAKENYAKGKVIIWGSSYSSALSLKLAGDMDDEIDGVLAFAPGEYFTRFGKPNNWIKQSAMKITGPAFITSAKKEHVNWKAIYDAIPSEKKQYFLPQTSGNHGSRALWEKFEDSGSYWEAVSSFLQQFLQSDADTMEKAPE